MNAIPVELSHLQAWNEDMPVMIGAVNDWIQRNHSRWPGIIFLVEKQQIDTRSIP